MQHDVTCFLTTLVVHYSLHKQPPMPVLVQVMELLKQRGCNEEFEPNPAMLADGMVEFLPCRTLSAEEMEAQMYGGSCWWGRQPMEGSQAHKGGMGKTRRTWGGAKGLAVADAEG